MRDLELTDQQYRELLQRQLRRLQEGVEKTSVDSDMRGSKVTEFSWGLCSETLEVYPTEDLQLFPDDFRDHGRIAPKYRDHERQPCPLDIRSDKQRKEDRNGCYYTCAHFKGHRYKGHLTRETAIKRYEERITEVGE